MFNLILSAALIAVSLSKTSFALSNTTSNNQIALYWGVNSNEEKSLAYYCQQNEADIILLSFLDAFPTLNLDLDENCSTDFSAGSSTCTSLEKDIITCQDLGVTVMLSLGGEAGSYGFSNTTQAQDFASTLWNTFAEGTADYRPFGSAVIDGFDFDIENNLDTGYTDLVNELRTIANDRGSKYYYISAAPQCVYPDAGTGDMLLNSYVDFAFIQFYNNYCNLGSANFNWDTWKTYAETKSPNPDIKLFLGLPGSEAAASTGYQSDLTVVDTAVKNLHSDANFGGIMLWDASYGYSNVIDGKTYVNQMKSILDKYADETTTSTSSSNPTTTSTTSTSSSIPAITTTTSKSSSIPTTTSTTSTSATTSTFASSSAAITSTSTVVPVITTSKTDSSFKRTTTLAPQSNSSSVVTLTPSSSITTVLKSSSTSTRNWDEPITTETITLANGQVTTSHIWWLPETAETTVTGSKSTRNWDEPLTTETITLANGQVTTSHIWWLPDSTVATPTASFAGNSTISTTSTRNWDEPLTTETVTLPNGQVTTSHIWWLPETTQTQTGTKTTKNWDEPVTTETVTLKNGQVTTTHIWWLPETAVA